MNKRLEDLAEQAGFPEWSQKTIGFELEKFAELIIHECAEAYHQTRPAGEPIETFFRKHLGVE
jgi:hypothetical protein